MRNCVFVAPVGPMAYVPPHRRQAPQEQQPEEVIASISDDDAAIPAQCGPRCAEWILGNARRCPQHAYLDSPETVAIAVWFSSRSTVFRRWCKTRRRAETNPEVQNCFRRPPASSNDRGAARWDSCQQNVAPLFNRFLRYAADIDVGVGYVGRAAKAVASKGSFTFLDMGFAPGGMTALLLDVDDRVRGVGVSLAPEAGGNVFPATLESSGRFVAIQDDILAVAKNGFRADVVPVGGFDLAIVGITISGSNQSDESEHADLKDHLHLAQMELALRHVRPGGMVLMRMHLSIRRLETQMLGVMLDRFRGRHAVTKPLTEFAMRKTYWVLFDGYEPDPASTDTLRNTVVSAEPVEDSTLVPFESIDAFLEALGPRMLPIVEPVWAQQSDVLDWIMSGKRSRLCGRCRATGKICRACTSYVMPAVARAFLQVSSRLASTKHPLLMYPDSPGVARGRCRSRRPHPSSGATWNHRSIGHATLLIAVP